MIYCVEDDAAIRNLMIYALGTAGFEAKGFEDGAAMFEALKTEKPQMVMLDIMLPGEDGISILKKLRARGDTRRVPVVMTTARGEEYDKVLALDLGADDYLAKPFGMMEMVSRVRAVLRRTEPEPAQETLLQEGALTLDPVSHRVLVDGREAPLTLKEYDLLYLMMTNRGRAFTRDALLSAVWNDDFAGETRTVDVHIGTLRAKLGPCASLIETVRGVGYRMGGKK